MVQQRVTILGLTFPVHVNHQNVLPVSPADYTKHAAKFYPNGVFAVTKAQAPGELAKACERIRGLQWTIQQRPEAGSPNSLLGQVLRAKYAVLWDRADYCLRIM